VATRKVERTPRRPRLKRGIARVSALKDAAAAILVTRGYDAATMTEIAARAHAPIGSLYQFFPTKESLAGALHDDLLEVLGEMLKELQERAAERAISPAELGVRVLRRLAEFLDLHPEFVVLMEWRGLDRERRRATRAFMQKHLVSLFAQAAPPLRKRRAEVIAVVILELMKTMLTLSTDEDEEMRAATLAELRRMLKTYLETI
jgi:AcrR family transcriptional regulator